MIEEKYVAKTYFGLEPILARELTELGCNNVQIANRAVEFTAPLDLLYRANLQCRTALRIIRPIRTFTFKTYDDIYDNAKQIAWEELFSVKETFQINSTVNSETATNSQFVTYRVKDAISDRFTELTKSRPSVSVSNPDIYIDVHISHSQCTISLDSSGESLHLRGYRAAQTDAPLSEVLAAGMLLLAGWNGRTDFIDPMCGSGTLLIEAALIALNIPPAIYRRHFAFEKWHNFDADLFEDIYNDDSCEREFKHKIYGYDVDQKAVNIAKMNIKSAGLSAYIEVECRDIKNFTPVQRPALIVTNPPYGERLRLERLEDLYKTIGTVLKNGFAGNSAWVISSHKEYLNAIGLHPSDKIKLKNGALDCLFYHFELFKGSRNEMLKSKYGDKKHSQKSDSHSSIPRDMRPHKETNPNNKTAKKGGFVNKQSWDDGKKR